MDFVHRREHKQVTIAAIATPIGVGGIAVLRLSGPEALKIANACCSTNLNKLPSHKASYTKVIDKEGTTVDEVLVLAMKAPRSFTGEDVVEIHCHGGMIIPNKILSLLLLHGASPAQPGEFSQRAFLNGKVDLSQAEAIQEMIAAKSSLAYSTAKDQLLGSLSKKIEQYQKRLSEQCANIEALIDYPEEGLEAVGADDTLEALSSIHRDMMHLMETFHDGKKLQEGVKLCLLGAPNVGKSSLLNALIKKERAIVTDIAGTTRDLIEEDLIIGDLLFHLADTAGLRDTQDVIEKIGIEKSQERAESSDLILYLVDSEKGASEEERQTIAQLPQDKLLVVCNKIDLCPAPEGLPNSVAISAKEDIGIETLKQAIQSKIYNIQELMQSDAHITKQRHFDALQAAAHHLQVCIEGLTSEVSPEFIAIDLKECLHHLGLIIGTNVTEDILDAIFSKFCVGK